MAALDSYAPRRRLDGSAFAPVGPWLAGLGALGVVVISALYAVASTVTSTPLPGTLPAAAAVAEGRVRLGVFRAAGSIGLVADLLLIAGCVLVAAGPSMARRLFWIWMGLATVIFIGVDGPAATALSRMIASPGAVPEGYIALRGLYDLCFAYGVAAIAAAVFAGAAVSGWPRWLRALCVVTGVCGTTAFLLDVVAGVILGPVFGVAVGLAGVVGIRAAALEAT